MDIDGVYKALLLRKELAGQPHLAHLNALAEAQLNKLNLDAKDEAEKAALEKRRKDQEEQMRKDREAAILAQGGAAHALLEREAAEKQAREAAVKQAAEADRLAKEQFDREEAARRAADPHGLRPPPTAVRPEGQPAQRPEDVPRPGSSGLPPRVFPSNDGKPQ